MELILKKDNKTLEFVSGSQEINVNDDLVQIISVMPEMPLAATETLCVAFGQNGTVAHTLPLFGDEGRYTTDIPQAMIDLGGEWEFQILRRRYQTSEHEGGFIQTASNKGAFTIGEGVKTVDGTLITTAMLTTLYREVVEDKAIIKEQVEEATTQAETALGNAESAAASASTAQENAAIAGSYATAAEVSAQSILPKLDAAETAAASASESAAVAMASVERAESAAVAAENAADAAVEKVSDLEKDIALLNTALMQGGIIYKADTETAYNERITAGGLNVLDGSLAKLEKVVGSTVKCNNLIDIPENFTWTVIYEKRKFELPAGTYTISCSSYEQGGAAPPHIRFLGVNNSDDIWTRVDKVYTKSFAGGEYTVYFYSADDAGSSGGITSTINKLMLNEGSSALPYQPYFEGLKNASFAGVESTGRNLFNSNDGGIVRNARVATSTGGVYSAQGYSVSGYIAVSGFPQVVISGANAQTAIYFAFYDKSKTFVSGGYKNDGTIISVPANANYLRFDFVSTETAVMVNAGTTALPYKPYIEPIVFEFPKTELGEWDEIDFEKQKVVRGMQTVVFDGTENWTLQSVNDIGIHNFNLPLSVDVKYGQGICNLYKKDDTSIANATSEGFLTTGRNLFIRSKSYTTVADWKAHLAELYASGKPLVIAYELATPTETLFTDEEKASGDEYQARAYGTEKVRGNDNAKFGANNTLSQNYIVVKE